MLPRMAYVTLAALALTWCAPVAAEEWSRAYISRLPDSAFAVVETAPDGRKVRHLPHHDEPGGLDPGGAEIGKRRRRWIGAPAPRKAESGHTFELFDGALGKIGRNCNEVVRHRAGIEIHEVLERCEGECGGRVDDGRAAMV